MARTMRKGGCKMSAHASTITTRPDPAEPVVDQHIGESWTEAHAGDARTAVRQFGDRHGGDPGGFAPPGAGRGPAGDRSIRRQLAVAAGNDRALREALEHTAFGPGDLDPGGRRDEAAAGPPTEPPAGAPTEPPAGVVQGRIPGLTDIQLAAIRTLTESWSRTHELVVAELQRRSVPANPIAPVGLTTRQRQVLALLGDGLKADAIARRLSLSPRTVEKHLERTYRRLGTSDRLSAVLQAKRIGLLDSGEATD